MRMDEIDDRDRAILRELMRDGRLSNVELSEKVHLSPSACLRRVRILEESGLIAGYVMLLDPIAAGLAGAATIVAPAATYSASDRPEPTPADVSTRI